MLLLKPGDEIKTDTPDGDFVLTDLHKNYLFIAGGIGITPFRSIIKALSLENKLPVIKLLYANKTTDIAFKTELEAIERDHNNLNISYVISPQSIDTILLKNKLGEIIEPDVYISGPESMVDKYLDELLVLGVSKDRIKTDYFPGYESY